MGESIAAWYLTQQGLRILGRNIEVSGGEVDLICTDGGKTVVVEVRTRNTDRDPIEAIDARKRDHVGSLASILGATRVDLVAIGIQHEIVNLHWVPAAV